MVCCYGSAQGSVTSLHFRAESEPEPERNSRVAVVLVVFVGCYSLRSPSVRRSPGGADQDWRDFGMSNVEEPPLHDPPSATQEGNGVLACAGWPVAGRRGVYPFAGLDHWTRR